MSSADTSNLEPVLVIHGVANREQPVWEELVSRLEKWVEQAGAHGLRLVPVFWGDLGGSIAGVEETLPEAEAKGAEALRSAATAQGMAMQEIRVRELRAAGLLSSALPGWLLGELDEWLGDGGRGVGAALTETVRRQALPERVSGIGDVLHYENARSTIQERLRVVLAGLGDRYGTEERPISLVAHSLGATIAFDAAFATAPPIWIRDLVTFGSQVSLLHILDPRRRESLPSGAALMPPDIPLYRPGVPVTLPRNVEGWTNIWERLDPFAFLMGRVFRLADGSSPRDVPLDHVPGVHWSEAHGSYWTHPSFPRLLVEALRG